jgi:hypothetical protein
MSVKQWWNNNYQGKAEQLGEDPDPVPLRLQ